MKPASSGHARGHLDSVCQYALRVLPAGDVPGVKAQISRCADCRKELESLRPVVEAFASWPADVLRPSTSLWDRLSVRITLVTGGKPVAEPPRSPEPGWEEAAPGIFCKLLSTDKERGRVSMLVRLAPGTEYPPHVHAGEEELHMLHGELLVNDTKLVAGDYLRSNAGSRDHRVWSETGCSGILITSIHDRLQ
jgi:hypothetical protein